MRNLLYSHALVAIMAICLGLVSAFGLVDSFVHITGGVLMPTGFMSLVGLASVWLLCRSIHSDKRFERMRPALEMIGGVLVTLGLINLAFPRFFGLLNYNLRPADLSVFFFGGIAMLLLALEHSPAATSQISDNRLLAHIQHIHDHSS